MNNFLQPDIKIIVSYCHSNYEELHLFFLYKPHYREEEIFKLEVLEFDSVKTIAEKVKSWTT